MCAQVIPTHHLGAQIVSLVNSATKELILISPYVHLWGQLESAIRGARNRGVATCMVFRRDQATKLNQTTQWLTDCGVKVLDCHRLHTKLYLTERACITTSMNLLQSSVFNNQELGTLFVKPDEIQIYRQSALQIIKQSAPPKPQIAPVLRTPFLEVDEGEEAGCCIRCGEEIDFNPMRPMCFECYREWAQYKNPHYAEGYCHDCGDEADTSMSRPLCYECWSDS